MLNIEVELESDTIDVEVTIVSDDLYLYFNPVVNINCGNFDCDFSIVLEFSNNLDNPCVDSG